MKQFNFILISLMISLAGTAYGQTNPPAYNLSTGDFSFTGFVDGESTTYPANTQGWRFASEPDATFIGEASDNRDLAAATSNPTSGSIKNEADMGISFLNSGSNGIGALVLALNTTGRENITLSWLAEDIRDGATRENGLKLQYRIGDTGDFTDVENTTYISDPTALAESVSFNDITLPSDADNAALVQVRWLYFFSSGGGARDRIRLDEIAATSDEGPAPMVAVTFQVDMSNQTLTGSGAGLSGTFNGFDFLAMNDQGDGLYSVTVDLEAGATVEYKFRNGDDYENVPGACGVGDFNNRSLEVPSEPTTIPVVCYASCQACAQTYDLTFQVDASQVNDVDAAGIHISGNFNGYNPEPMTDAGDGMYTFTAQVEEGSEVLWKYLNGSSYDFVESVPSDCGSDDGFGGFNRNFTMPSEDTTQDVVCFGSCEACETPLEMYDLTLRVNASQIFDFDFAGVHIAGNFNDYTPQPMTNVGILNYVITVQVEEGSTVLWKFLNGNSFDGAEGVPAACGDDDGFGGFNRIFVMPSQDTVLTNVCFASCNPCGVLTQNELTFQVDASQLDVIHPQGIFIAGSFTESIPEPMTDAGDGIYTYTLLAVEGQPLTWKYLNGPNNADSETVPAACGVDVDGSLNRNFTMVGEDATLDLVCFSTCVECIEPGQMFNLVFQVDASQVGTIDPAGLHIAGSFNNWTPEPMQDGGSGFYSFLASVEAGTNVQWKYLNSTDFNGQENVTSACGTTDGFGGFNRTFDMPAENIVLDVVCFSSCQACGDPAETYTLVFQVNASQLGTVDPVGIHIAGTFNNFSPQPMQTGGSGIYTFSAEIEAGETVLWKYLNGASFDNAEQVPGECGADDGFGGFNRTFEMPTQNNVLGAVCFSSCEDCIVGVSNADAHKSMNIFPNPNNGDFNIEVRSSGDAEVRIFDLSGRLIYSHLQYVRAGENVQIFATIPSSGMYLVQMRIDQENYIAKISVF